jgi:hypothetical protein
MLCLLFGGAHQNYVASVCGLTRMEPRVWTPIRYTRFHGDWEPFSRATVDRSMCLHLIRSARHGADRSHLVQQLYGTIYTLPMLPTQHASTDESAIDVSYRLQCFDYWLSIENVHGRLGALELSGELTASWCPAGCCGRSYLCYSAHRSHCCAEVWRDDGAGCGSHR